MNKVQISLLCCVFVGMFQYLVAQQSGCTDPQALNFDWEASVNDGSCLYPLTSHSPKRLAALPAELPESSGLVQWETYFLSHNDSGWPAELFVLDSTHWGIQRILSLRGVSHRDWEDITADELHVYIGDFGNNNGNRTDLAIHKIAKSELSKDTLEAQSIFFQYPDQNSFVAAPQAHDFDMEAMISLGDSLYLFSKNWANNKTKVYALPKQEGHHLARWVGEWDVQGLITGAALDSLNKRIVLVGYSPLLLPFAWILWDFEGNNFFSGNKRRIELNLPFHQVEAIAYDAFQGRYVLTNERFSNFLVTIPARVHEFSIASWVENPTVTQTFRSISRPLLYPNPAKDGIFVRAGEEWITLYLGNHMGIVLEQHPLKGGGDVFFDLSLYPNGVYFVTLQNRRGEMETLKVLKRF
jgi:hypothetical protein